MRVQVWYNAGTDPERPGLADFKQGQNGEPIAGDYSLIFDDYILKVHTDNDGGNVKALAEVVFRMFNVVSGDEKPVELGVRSLSVGDIVIINGRVLVCRNVGFEEVEDGPS